MRTFLQQCRQENRELQGEMELVRLEALDPNKRGNSLFGEVEDRRVQAEKKLIRCDERVNICLCYLVNVLEIFVGCVSFRNLCLHIGHESFCNQVSTAEIQKNCKNMITLNRVRNAGKIFLGYGNFSTRFPFFELCDVGSKPGFSQRLILNHLCWSIAKFWSCSDWRRIWSLAWRYAMVPS